MSRILTYNVTKEGIGILDFLYSEVKASRTTIKSYLRNRQVAINSIPTTQYDTQVHTGDVVTIDLSKQKPLLRNSMVNVIYEDDDIIVIHKKEGLLSITTEKEKTRTAYNIVSEYVKQFNPESKIFIVHRLDRETSGIIIFAKNIQTQHALQYNWEERVIQRKYYAVVEGDVKKESDIIETYLIENKALKVIATNKPIGKIAKTSYKVIKRGNGYTLLELQLQTGRKNQIRAHLSYLGHPIVGDMKYDSSCNPIHRMALHAGEIKVLHPRTDKEMTFTSDMPKIFEHLTD